MVGICWDFKGFRTGFGNVGVAFFLFLVHFEGWNLADTPTVEQLITAFFSPGLTLCYHSGPKKKPRGQAVWGNDELFGRSPTGVMGSWSPDLPHSRPIGP